jgi:general secretion pathway protein G
MIANARRGSRAKRRGVTLVEVLIVVAIMAVIAGTVTVYAFGELKTARVRAAAIGAGAVREAARIHRDVDLAGSDCPSIADLIAARKLDAKRSADPWHTRYEVRCEEDDVHGVSAGADRRPQTADDVRDDVTPADVERIAKM